MDVVVVVDHKCSIVQACYQDLLLQDQDQEQDLSLKTKSQDSSIQDQDQCKDSSVQDQNQDQDSSIQNKDQVSRSQGCDRCHVMENQNHLKQDKFQNSQKL